MNAAQRFLGLGITIGLVGGLLVGLTLVRPGAARATTPSPAPVAGQGVLGAPVGDTVVSGASVAGGAATGTVTSGVGVAQSGTAIAYPYPVYAGNPGLAPDNTIVVTGVGQAQLRADGSDRASAERIAIAGAMADARTQADAIAAAGGLSIGGVLSVSAALSPAYGPMPMAVDGSGTVCPARAPTATGVPGPATVPEPACLPIEYQPSLTASVTVAYRVG